jgi:hypothetical protein
MFYVVFESRKIALTCFKLQLKSVVGSKWRETDNSLGVSPAARVVCMCVDLSPCTTCL